MEIFSQHYPSFLKTKLRSEILTGLPLTWTLDAGVLKLDELPKLNLIGILARLTVMSITRVRSVY